MAAEPPLLVKTKGIDIFAAERVGRARISHMGPSVVLVLVVGLLPRDSIGVLVRIERF